MLFVEQGSVYIWVLSQQNYQSEKEKKLRGGILLVQANRAVSQLSFIPLPRVGSRTANRSVRSVNQCGHEFWLSLMLSKASLLPALPPTIKQVLSAYLKPHCEHEHAITVHGWIKSVRRQKNVSFAVVNDGTTLRGLQAVFLQNDAEQIKRLTAGASVRLTGKLIESLGKGQDCELRVENVEVLGDCEPEVILIPVFLSSFS